MFAMENEIKINVPEGMEIDKENSTFECIKFKPVDKIDIYRDYKKGDFIIVYQKNGKSYEIILDKIVKNSTTIDFHTFCAYESGTMASCVRKEVISLPIQEIQNIFRADIHQMSGLFKDIRAFNYVWDEEKTELVDKFPYKNIEGKYITVEIGEKSKIVYLMGSRIKALCGFYKVYDNYGERKTRFLLKEAIWPHTQNHTIRKATEEEIDELEKEVRERNYTLIFIKNDKYGGDSVDILKNSPEMNEGKELVLRGIIRKLNFKNIKI